jgi:acetyl esterase/lipase
MLSRKDVRPSQTQLLLDAGFLPVSVDYRLCPETTLLEGPMLDVRDSLEWARTTLPKLTLQRPDVRVSGDQVVAVGWSTGGHLALTLGFTSPTPPQAILAFYCPTDYEDPFWSQTNVPFGSELAPPMDESTYDLLEGVYDHPITAYNPPALNQALGGWMAPSDPRSRIALHMNWKGQTLPFLLNGLKCKGSDIQTANLILPTPTLEQIQSVSPLSQIRRGNYRTPTFLIHGTQDDLIPWQQLQRTHTALQDKGVIAELRLLDGAIHLFDLDRRYEKNDEAVRAVRDGYKFLYRHVEH